MKLAMTKRHKIMKIMYFLAICSTFLLSQDHIDGLIQQVLHGSRDSAAISLSTIELEYPNNPSVMYLKGLLETDGEKAMTIFSKLYNTHPTSEYGDDAVMKVAEYYYVAGLYVQAADWLKKMPIYYSRSEHIERAVKLFLNSLIVSGLKDTAIFYSRVFERQFPELDVDGKINDLLEDFEESNQQKVKPKEQSDAPYEFEGIPIELPEDSTTKQNNANSPMGNYSLQTGAYNIKENAELQITNLLIAGFSARVTELHRNNMVLYAVRIGYYKSKDDAGIIGLQIKTKLDLDTILISNN